MSPTGAAGKICVICGQDCSNKPRVKDPQGRYFCKACHEAALKKPAGGPPRGAARPAAPPPEPEPAFDNVENESFLAGVESTGMEPCPGCGVPLASIASVCMSCGYNKQTGRSGRVSVKKAPRERPRVPLTMSPGILFFISLVVLGGLFAAGLASPLFAVAFLLVYVLYALVGAISMIVLAFKDGNSGWGVVGLLSIIVPCLGLAMLYYVFAVNTRPILKVLIGVQLLCIPMYLILGFQLGLFSDAGFGETGP